MPTLEFLQNLGLFLGVFFLMGVAVLLALILVVLICSGICELVKWYKRKPEEPQTSIAVEPITYERAWDKKQRRKRVNQKRKQAAKARRR